MKSQKPIVLLVMGIAVLAVGFVISLLFPEMGQMEKVTLMREAGQTGGAKAAAEAVSSINQKEMITHIISMFCYGLGAAFTLIGAIGFFKGQKQ